MRIRFERTMEDYMAYQEFYNSHSPTLRKALARSRWAGTIAVWVLSVIVCFGLHPNMLGFILTLATIGAAFYAWYFPHLYRRRVTKLVNKMFAEGKINLFIGEHEIEVVEDGIVTRSNLSESRYAWGAIERIESTADHTFIFVGPANALVIPHHSIRAGSYQELMTEIGKKFKPHQPLQNTLLESS